MKTAMTLAGVAVTGVGGFAAGAFDGCSELAGGLDEGSNCFAETTVRPEARLETEPVPNDGDAADDPAIWIHPRRADSSLVLGTDKDGGLHVYGMDGMERDVVSPGSQPNNVDVAYGFPLGGERVDLALASVAGDGGGLKVWAVDAATPTLSDVTGGGTLRVLDGTEPYGVCAYRSARTGRFYAFVTSEDGALEQHELNDDGNGRVVAERVRSLDLGSTAEGCAADHELGVLYVAEEEVGIWKLDAEPDASGTRSVVSRVGENGLEADVEGLAIYFGPDGAGYLIASSQGNDTFKVYERAGENRFLLTIDPRDGGVDDVGDTDGIDVTNCATSGEFGQGVFVAQDGGNEDGNQNFKLYAWEEIAEEGRLRVDTSCRPRGGT